MEVTMSTETHGENSAPGVGARTFETKLEVVIIPVSDVERAKRFYGGLGWKLDADFSNGPDWRVVQMTPPARKPPSNSARESRRPRPAQ
jgi:bleomycin resistance family protein